MKKIHLTLVAIFLLAFLLRVFYLPQKSLTFGYDQARDAMQSIAITQGDLKIQGPSASTPGLFHGVFYYYVLAPAYAIGEGDPIIVAYWIALLNAATVFLVFAITNKIFKNKIASLLSAFVFAISFESTQYAVWLSNPTIAIWTVPLYYLGLWSWLKEDKKLGALLAGVGLGLSVQAEIFLLYHLVPGLVLLWLANREKSVKYVLPSFFGFLVAVSTMILVEFKFGFRSIAGFSQLANSTDAIGFAGRSFGDYLLLYLNQIGRVAAYSIYPGNVWLGAGFVFLLIFASLCSWRKWSLSWQPFLLVWILSHITVVSVGGTSTPFLLVGIAPAICMLVGIHLSRIWNSKNRLLTILIIGIITFANLSMIAKENPRGQTIFAIQKDMLLSKQLQAINYTYQSSAGEQFSINTLTSPLWINIVWTYLYKWYAEPKHGRLPTWHGRDQVGQLDSLPRVDSPAKLNFLILEPIAGIPQVYLTDLLAQEDARSKVVEEKRFGELIVQKRILYE